MPLAKIRRSLTQGEITSMIHSQFCSLPYFLCSLNAPKNTHKQLVTPWLIATIIILTPALTPTIHHILYCHQHVPWHWLSAAISAHALMLFLKEYSHHQNSSKLAIKCHQCAGGGCPLPWGRPHPSPTLTPPPLPTLCSRRTITPMSPKL